MASASSIPDLQAKLASLAELETAAHERAEKTAQAAEAQKSQVVQKRLRASEKEHRALAAAATKQREEAAQLLLSTQQAEAEAEAAMMAAKQAAADAQREEEARQAAEEEEARHAAEKRAAADAEIERRRQLRDEERGEADSPSGKNAQLEDLLAQARVATTSGSGSNAAAPRIFGKVAYYTSYLSNTEREGARKKLYMTLRGGSEADDTKASKPLERGRILANTEARRAKGSPTPAFVAPMSYPVQKRKKKKKRKPVRV